jgi:hypothetical protein
VGRGNGSSKAGLKWDSSPELERHAEDMRMNVGSVIALGATRNLVCPHEKGN